MLWFFLRFFFSFYIRFHAVSLTFFFPLLLEDICECMKRKRKTIYWLWWWGWYPFLEWHGLVIVVFNFILKYYHMRNLYIDKTLALEFISFFSEHEGETNSICWICLFFVVYSLRNLVVWDKLFWHRPK